MDIFGNKQLRLHVQELQKQYDKSLKVQESMILTINDLQAQDVQYAGNAYRNYATAVQAINDKYNATAKWGVVLTGNIIDLRAAFIIGNGVKVMKSEGLEGEEGNDELEWAEDFLEFNRITHGMDQEFAKEAEIEGKIAFLLNVDEAKEFKQEKYPKFIEMRYLSWLTDKYKIEAAPDDYLDYQKLIRQPKGKPITVNQPDFIYNKFGGRVADPNQAQPKIMKCLTQIDDVDYALRDWREINHIFAAPIPVFNAQNEEGAKDAQQQLRDFNMKIKKALILLNVEAMMLGPDIKGIESIQEEIVMKIKIISGITGLPVHFLGLLDLLKTRATGDNTRELIMAATNKERKIWEATYQEAITKAMDIWNNQTNRNKARLNPDFVEVVIPFFTEAQWLHIEKVLLPMFLAGGLSKESLLAQVPDIKVAEEIERLAGDNDTETQRIQAENANLRAQNQGQDVDNI